ncbi:MAG: 2-dehydropantoate 2-reductase [Deltaproteobacteria bacterium]|nr:2-dehydropantoate 2-reductase [Deltaproteobacteria bacterium]
MRILVVGAGALGGLIGARLSEAGEDVTFLENNVARAKLLSDAGLFLSEGETGERLVRLKVVTSVAGMPPVDLVFIAVKSYQTTAAVKNVLPVVGDKTWVLSTQNGIGNVEQIAAVLQHHRILSGITFHSIQHTGPNRLRYRTGIKPIQMAPFDGRLTPEVTAIGDAFNAAGLKTQVVANVDHAVWQKLLHNAVVNPISALTGMSCSELLEDDDLQILMRELNAEIIAVMRARGVPIEDEEDPYRPVVRSQKALAKNRPSMWQDLVRGFRTEIDAMNGGVVREAERLGLKAPVNFAIVKLVHSRERQQQRRADRGARTLEAVKTAQAKMPLKALPRTRLGGMPSGRVPLACAPKLKELIRDYYLDLAEAGRDPQRHVAWCSGFGPVEVLRALGYTPYFPENHAALIGASRLTGKYIRLALADGFSPFASSEMASDIGAMLAGESPLVGIHGIEAIPRPEVLVYNTNFGAYLARWFEYYSHRLGVPLLGLHPPAVLDEVEKIEIDASVQQLLRLIDRLEHLAGRKLDHDELAAVVERSARAALLWGRILDLARNVPSPLTYFDTLIHVAPMLLMRGSEQAITYYEVLLAELEDRIRDGVAAVPGERLRFYWEGPPIWCALRPLASLFLDQQVAVVASTYPRVFALAGLDRDNPIESMATTYTSIFPNRSREQKARWLAGEYQKYAVDAAIYHDARTCPDHSTVRYGLHLRLYRDTNVPAIVIEADTHDLRLVSLDQIRRQVMEQLENLGPAGGHLVAPSSMELENSSTKRAPS